MTTREIGNIGEDFVCKLLINKNYTIVKRNYTMRGGEIDIIAVKDGIIAFVEVKSRKTGSLENGFEAITKAKKLHIIKTAQNYFEKNQCDLQPRFDVASVIVDKDIVKSVDYIENAYDMSDTNIIF